jgi:hypothetical protein
MPILLRFGCPEGFGGGWGVSEAVEAFVTSLAAVTWLGLTTLRYPRHFQSMARKHRKLPDKRGIPGTTTYIRVAIGA